MRGMASTNFSLMRSALRMAIGLRDVLLRPDELPTLFQTLGGAESLQFSNQELQFRTGILIAFVLGIN